MIILHSSKLKSRDLSHKIAGSDWVVEQHH
jgi:hypothetical protein